MHCAVPEKSADQMKYQCNLYIGQPYDSYSYFCNKPLLIKFLWQIRTIQSINYVISAC